MKNVKIEVLVKEYTYKCHATEKVIPSHIARFNIRLGWFVNMELNKGRMSSCCGEINECQFNTLKENEEEIIEDIKAWLTNIWFKDIPTEITKIEKGEN